MICTNCGVGEVCYEEITMERKVYHVNEATEKKAQLVDTIKSSCTFGHCDHCHMRNVVDVDTETMDPEEYTTEEMLDELGIET